jgi:hypothetical protein
MTEPQYIPQTIRPGDSVVVEPKNPLASTTLQGLLVAILARLLRVAVERYFPNIVGEEQWIPIATEILGWVIGGFMIVWGRWTASRPLGGGGPKQVLVH